MERYQSKSSYNDSEVYARILVKNYKLFRVFKKEGREFIEFQKQRRQTEHEAIMLHKRTSAVVLITYRWRRYWVSDS
jgi:hypothetical protein